MKYIDRLAKAIVWCLFVVLSWCNAHASLHSPKQLILLFHGLASNAASFVTIQQGLEKAFPTATVIALSSAEGSKTVTLSIAEQVEACFKELSSKVKHIDHIPILLVGHSQGGLRAYLFLKQYQHLLNVKGLVALAAPWEGAPGARVDVNMLQQHVTDAVAADLRVLSLALGYPADALATQMMREIQVNQSMCSYPGVKDMMVGSPCLCKIRAYLVKEKVPILSIGGGQSNFKFLLSSHKIKYRFKALNDMYTLLTVGLHQRNLNHDMKIPLYSQHALNIIPHHTKIFKRIFIKDIFHSAHVWSIVAVPPHKSILEHPRVLRMMIKFTKNLFFKK